MKIEKQKCCRTQLLSAAASCSGLFYGTYKSKFFPQLNPPSFRFLTMGAAEAPQEWGAFFMPNLRFMDYVRETKGAVRAKRKEMG